MFFEEKRLARSCSSSLEQLVGATAMPPLVAYTPPGGTSENYPMGRTTKDVLALEGLWSLPFSPVREREGKVPMVVRFLNSGKTSRSPGGSTPRASAMAWARLIKRSYSKVMGRIARLLL